MGREDVSEPASVSTGIAARYASALFDLAREEGALKALEADAEALKAALAASPDLAAMIASPVISRGEQARPWRRSPPRWAWVDLTASTLALMAEKRRLFVLPQFLNELAARIADEKGEVTAEVTSATALTRRRPRNWPRR
jgi:F-type H+-transporting ATPase subunit delta